VYLKEAICNKLPHYYTMRSESHYTYNYISEEFKDKGKADKNLLMVRTSKQVTSQSGGAGRHAVIFWKVEGGD
jgi:hypothetical protein